MYSEILLSPGINALTRWQFDTPIIFCSAMARATFPLAISSEIVRRLRRKRNEYIKRNMEEREIHVPKIITIRA